jgi:hypothetical protein
LSYVKLVTCVSSFNPENSMKKVLS